MITLLSSLPRCGRTVCTTATTTTRHAAVARAFSSTANIEPVLPVEAVRSNLVARANAMAQALTTSGYYTASDFLNDDIIHRLRAQCIVLRRECDRFEPSWSEKIVNGQAVQFEKEGVYACEPDGRDYTHAPDLIQYMSALLQTLPEALNQQQQQQHQKSTTTQDWKLSNTSFNAKLAVTSPGGSTYPLHIDNPEGIAVGDTRKLTCILYLNPDYQQDDGGELQLTLGDNNVKTLTPIGGRLVLFWSDEIPHQVLPTAPDAQPDDCSKDRYALTVWIPTDNVSMIHNTSSPFSCLHMVAFPTAGTASSE